MIKYLKYMKWKKVIKESGLFDAKYYLFTYPDVRKKLVDPIKHYILYGADEGRNPSLSFDTNSYLEANPDVKENGMNPLVHYILYGESENRIMDSGIISTHAIDEINTKDDEKEGYECIAFNNPFTPIVSIIVPVFNQFEFTYRCLESIFRNSGNIDFEIIIADDMSNDETSHAEKYFKNVKVVRTNKNYGFLLNCNNAAKYSRGKYILFLNNDTYVQPNWLKPLVELIESDDTIGMVGSRLIYPDGRQQEAGGIIWNDASGWNFGRLDDPDKPEYNYVKDVDYISGASLMIRKELWKRIGGFDERFAPAYCEDSDLAFEVRRLGYRVVYQPKSMVVHFEGVSNGTDTGSGVKHYQVVNKEKLFKKWKEVLEKEHFKNAQNVFLARDRSRFKKHILVIDHYVPQFDKDAGSRTVFGYLKMFIEEGFRVTFLGDNFYRHEPYTEILQQMGIEVLYGKWYANNWEKWWKDNGKYFDYVFLNRPHISEKYIDMINQYSEARIIYYGHDLHFLRIKREYEITGSRKKFTLSEEWRERELSLMRKADISLYPSEIEVSEIRRIDKNIRVQSMPAYLYTDFNIKRRIVAETKDIMFVGGFAHQPNVDAVIWFVNEIWESIKKRYPELKFYIIGSNPTNEIMNIQSEDIIVTGFVSDDTLRSYYENCRISVVPLRYGAGIKGKVVEALYNQMPVVTTSIGAEGLEEADKYMIIADQAEDFANEVIQLYDDEERLNDMCINSMNYCERHFSYSAAKRSLENVIEFDKKAE